MSLFLEHTWHSLRRAQGLCVALSLLSLGIVAPRRAVAHELEVDQLALMVPPSGDELQAELIFDPELTRRPNEKIASEVAEARVLDFVRAELHLTVDEQPCAPEFEVRELDDGSGAVGGDTLIVHCRFATPGGTHRVRVRLGERIRPLMVKGAVFGESGSLRSVSELVSSGGVSPQFEFGVMPPKQEARPRSVRRVPELLASYGREGFRHIIPQGLDHVLFVVGVVLTAENLRRLALELSTFTLAHSLTLALASYGFVRVPGNVVEPLIALSIALLGFEALTSRERRPKLKLGIVFCFGLLHGLGFASALAESSPLLGSFLIALLGFNLGVEVGQLTVAALAWGTLLLLRSTRVSVEKVRQGLAVALLLVGLGWTLERLNFL